MKGPFVSRRAAPRFSHHHRVASVEALEGRRLLATAAGLGQLPLAFEANQGQVSSPVQFLAHAGASTLFITPTSATLALPSSAHAGTAVRMQLVGASATPAASGVGQLPGVTNYLAGADSTGAHLGVTSYGAVEERGVYPGVDLTYHGAGSKLEYDFTVAPGADPGIVRLQFAGEESAALDSTGNLVLHTASGDLVEQAPTLYQQVGSTKQAVAGHFTLGSGGQVGFSVGAYSKSLPLVIDPVLGFSTYLGGGSDYGGSIAVDATGATYLTGGNYSATFPTTPGAYQTTGDTYGDVVVTKLNPAGTALVYSTYIGLGQASGIAINAAGDAYLTGTTSSTTFPTTTGAFQTTSSISSDPTAYNTDSFVTELNPTGTALVYSTFLGGTGTNDATGIAVDAAGHAFVTGLTSSAAFPTTPGAFQTTAQPSTVGVDAGTYQEAFVTEFKPDGSGLVYSTFLGGAEDQAAGYAIAVDPADEAVVTGLTLGSSDTFPTTAGAYLKTDAGLNAESLGFVTKFNAAGSALVYSTYLGGPATPSPDGMSFPEEFINPGAVALDPAGNIYVAGIAGLSSNIDSTTYPTTSGAYQTAGSTLFLTKINPASSVLVYSSLFGGHGTLETGESVSGLVVDAAGDAYVTGQTSATDFPILSAFQPTFGGGTTDSSTYTYATDDFVTEFNPAGSVLLFSSYLGGSGNEIGGSIALDPLGNIYVSGTTPSTDFPTTAGAFNPTYVSDPSSTDFGATDEFFLVKISPSAEFAAATASVPVKSGSAVVTITRTGSTIGTATIHVATADGTGVAGTDYGAVNQTITFAPGVASQEVTIPLIAAAPGTANRTILLTLSDPTGNLALGTQATTTLTLVEEAAATLAVTAAPTPFYFGQTVTITATLTPVGITTTPTGTVTFQSGSGLDTTVPVNAAGQAVLTTASLPVGYDNISVVYNGDAIFGISTGAVVQQVKAAQATLGVNIATLNVSSSPNPSNFGQAVTITATVTPVSGSITPTGTVTFQNGPTYLGSAQVNASGVAVFTTSTLPTGYDDINASYSGDSNYGESTGGTTQQVNQSLATLPAPNPIATLLALATSPGVPVAGQPFALIATVAPVAGSTAAGIPTGTVTFLDGITLVALLPLDASGHAVLFLPALGSGSHQFTAVYSGDAADLDSAGATVPFTAVDLLPPTVQSIARVSTAGHATTAVAVTFDEPLNPTVAQYKGNYRVTTTSGATIKVKSATYDGATATVTLRLAGPLAPRARYRLAINGTPLLGVEGANNQFLAGKGTGHAGTNYRGTIPAATAKATSVRAMASHPRGPSAKLHNVSARAVHTRGAK